MIFIRKKIANIYMVKLTSFTFPENNFTSVKLNIPKMIPLAILYVNGIKMMVINAGRPELMSLKLMSPTELIINKPMIINAGAVAEAGTIRKMGAKNNANTNITVVLTLESPVRPPAATPDALSMYEVLGLVPNSAPTNVPNASAKSAFCNWGKLPSALDFPIFEITPISVPIASKILTIKKVNTTISISNVRI